MKIYIAGRITGNPNYKAQFKATAAMLQEEGHTVLNPAELPEGMKPADYMRICFAMLDSADFSTDGRRARAQNWSTTTQNTSGRKISSSTILWTITRIMSRSLPL